MVMGRHDQWITSPLEDDKGVLTGVLWWPTMSPVGQKIIDKTREAKRLWRWWAARLLWRATKLSTSRKYSRSKHQNYQQSNFQHAWMLAPLWLQLLGKESFLSSILRPWWLLSCMLFTFIRVASSISAKIHDTQLHHSSDDRQSFVSQQQSNDKEEGGWVTKVRWC